jgi:ABC-type nitrate/sulfonate/bicarbonate transport system substrate-binding protein
MGEALSAGDVDVAMLLTEGAVAGIANGAKYRILCCYTRSPLSWGIHVPAPAAELTNVDDSRGARYAISRYGSGSHLMSFAHARERAWPTDDLEFVVVGDLAGAVRAFAERRADAFLWEKFMTKPLVESGQFRRVGEFVAPWPAFVVCVAENAWRQRQAEIRALVAAVLESTLAISAAPDSARRIASHYGLTAADVTAWLGTTRWATRVEIDPAELDRVLAVLVALGLVPRGLTGQSLIAA